MRSSLLIIMIVGVMISAFACSLKPKVKEEVKSLSTLKTECDNLQIELESLGAKKWTKVIDDKVKQCKDHGFWEEKKRKMTPNRDFLDVE